MHLLLLLYLLYPHNTPFVHTVVAKRAKCDSVLLRYPFHSHRDDGVRTNAIAFKPTPTLPTSETSRQSKGSGVSLSNRPIPADTRVVSVSVCLSACHSACHSVCLSASLSLSVSLSLSLPVCLCLSVCLFSDPPSLSIADTFLILIDILLLIVCLEGWMQ